MKAVIALLKQSLLSTGSSSFGKSLAVLIRALFYHPLEKVNLA